MKKLFVFLALFPIILCGCNRNNTLAIPNYVTGVDITCSQNGKDFSIKYQDNEKVEAVLLYLRLLEPRRLPGNIPQQEDRSLYQIRVHLSSGESRLYKQVDHQFFWQEKAGWKGIPPEQASGLYALLRHYQSDL